MQGTKEARIRDAAAEDRCPQCARPLGSSSAERRRVGSGRLADGVFCSLECFAAFHKDAYDERIANGVPSRN